MRKPILIALVAAALAGCYVADRDAGLYAEVSPPAPRYVEVVARPGYLWVDGHWYWSSDRWLWSDGYYLVDRPGYVYVPGTYRGHVWERGYWRNGGGGYRPGPSQATQAVRQAYQPRPSEAQRTMTPRPQPMPRGGPGYSPPARSNGGGRSGGHRHR
jgi:YXWGXW repeat-containing protein